tara:strand:- start:244 stop:1536 length:1293 start_codon:yes stop_codon:yes gene_type:complete
MAEIRVNSTGALKLYDSDDSNYVALQSAGTVSSDITWTLPSADGSNGQFIKTDGSGALSFGSVSSALDDITTGDAASTLATSAGNITIDAQGNDTDIIFKGTDNSSDITMLTLDGSEAGAATFNAGITATTGTFSGIVDADAGVTIDNITIDGTEIDLSSGDLTLDVAGDIIFDAGGNNFKFSSGGTQVLDIANSSSDVIIKPTVDAKDIIFQQYDGNEVMRINDSRKLQFYDDGGESITSDGSKLVIESGGTTFNLPTSDGSNGQALTTNGSGTLSFADAGGGKCLQVQSTWDDSKTSSTSTGATYYISVNITPSASTSKILVWGMLTLSHSSGSSTRTGTILKRDSTTFTNSGADWENHFGGSFNPLNSFTHASGPTQPFLYLDSPNTTSQVTYSLGGQQTGGTTYYNRSGSNNVEFTSSIVVMEIGA